MVRFYRLSVVETLFGEWAMVREWGRIGCPARGKDEWFTSSDDAQAALERQLRIKERRGYRRPL